MNAATAGGLGIGSLGTITAMSVPSAACWMILVLGDDGMGEDFVVEKYV